MFGYVTTNQDELKMKDVRRYKGYYCGLCNSYAKRYGVRGQMVLPYDMAFLNILLNGLYELPLKEKDITCIRHPLEKQHMVSNEITDYCADIGLMLVYFKLLDDAADDGSIRAKTAAGLLKSKAHAASQRWPRQAEHLERYIREQIAAEKQGKMSLDEIAGISGKVLGELFVWKDDLWSDILRRMGFYLGKYIYLLDAYEDLEKDRKKKSFNPWESLSGRADFDACVENALTMMMAECAKEFEKLPIVQDIEILRNIIYSGVWVKYYEIRKKRDS